MTKKKLLADLVYRIDQRIDVCEEAIDNRIKVQCAFDYYDGLIASFQQVKLMILDYFLCSMTKKQLLHSLRERLSSRIDFYSSKCDEFQKFSVQYEYHKGCVDAYESILNILNEYD